MYGPKSKLYTFEVYYRIEYNYFIDRWHREDWYNEKDDDCYYLIEFNNNYSKRNESLVNNDKIIKKLEYNY